MTMTPERITTGDSTMTAVEVCPICDIARCKHIRERQSMNAPKSPLCIGPLTPFCCEYTKRDGRYGIALYGLTAQQVIEDNRDRLENLKVIGILHEVIPCDTPRDTEGEE